jgi:endonuclease-8
MPEGDTIFRSATSLRRWVVGRRLTEVRTSVPGLDGSRLVGRTVEAVETVGKHLLIRCSGGLTIHTHMRMTGSWHLYPTGERWQRPAGQARLVLVAADRLAVCFNAPIVEVLDAKQELSHPSLSRLGPDVLASEAPDPIQVQRRARARASAAPTVGELLLDQQVVSGIGNIYRCESLFLCGVHPAMRTESLSDELLDRLVTTASRLMKASADPAGRGGRTFAPTHPALPASSAHSANQVNPAPPRKRGAFGGSGAASGPWVYRQSGRPCRRCGTVIRRGLLGRQARSVYWCPTCQPSPRPGSSYR